MDSILDKTLIFTPKNNKTNYSIPFTLEHSYDRLNISCRYSPKIVDDLELAKHEIEIGLQPGWIRAELYGDILDKKDQLLGFTSPIYVK